MPTNNQNNERPHRRAAHFRTPDATQQGTGSAPRIQAQAAPVQGRPTGHAGASSHMGAAHHTGTAQRMSSPAPGSTGAIGGTTSHLSARTAAATKRARSQSPQRRGSGGGRGNGPKGITVVVAVLAGVAAFVALFFVLVLPRLTQGSSSNEPQVAAGQEVEVTIPDGSSTASIASILQQAGVISDTSGFVQEVQKQNAEQKLKSGTYSLLTGSATTNVIDQLVTGPNSTASTLQVPEGYTVAQVASLVEEKFGISSGDFIAQAKASNYVADYPFLSEAANDSLEGFLFPKTYDFAGRLDHPRYAQPVSGRDCHARPRHRAPDAPVPLRHVVHQLRYPHHGLYHREGGPDGRRPHAHFVSLLQPHCLKHAASERRDACLHAWP